MIEKLDKHLANNINSCNMSQNIMVAHKAIEKINELVDAVNELQKHEEQHLDLLTELNEMRLHQKKESAENVQDEFAEQRKWIGCVCRFWFDNPDNTVLDYLGKIQTGENGIEYYGKETYDWFPHCEPILPTDNVIYKGSNNDDR